MGLKEIADRLNVKQQTAAAWKHRGLLPEPEGTVSGMPAWRWSTEFRFLPIYRDTFRFYLLRWSSDAIARANGWQFHVDGVHLNRRGGTILADLVQAYLDV